MSRYYRRTTPGVRENWGAGLVAAGLALGVASLSFYLVRAFLAREPLEPVPRGPAGRGDRDEKLPSTAGPEEDGG
ncbi:MAG: hypothetical protein ACWGSQ_07120 [Longimicrobiales bacterium]